MATATPVTLLPTRWPLFFFFSSQLKSAAPLSSASFTKALVTLLRGRSPGAGAPAGGGGSNPNSAGPDGPLILRISTWSTPSLRAASWMSGSNITGPCTPPGRTLRRAGGGVLVATEMPRNRMFGTW